MTEDIKLIQEQFNKIIAYSQCGIEAPKTDKLFEDWLEAKRDIIEGMLNGELIYEYPEDVSFELSDKEKAIRTDDFSRTVANRYNNVDLANFIDNQSKGFFSNITVSDYEYNGTIIPKGMKIVKAFKFFESDETTLNSIQSAASMIIQENKIEGRLCFSVHPLDFLSTSENAHSWRSCHALDGDYRSGNLSYMVDRSTLVCYIKSKKNTKLPNFPSDVLWNSKKWRVLIYLSENWDMIFAGRQYPFSTQTGLNYLKTEVFPHIGLGEHWSNWTNYKIRDVENPQLEQASSIHMDYPYIPLPGRLVPMNKLIINGPGSLHYNDLLQSTCYDAMYCYRMTEPSMWWFSRLKTNKKTIFNIGGGCNCLRCGAEKVELTGSMMCNDCELAYGDSDDEMFGYCSCCGRRILSDDGWWVYDDFLCESCIDTQTEICAECGYRYYLDDMIYSSQHDGYICYDCNACLELEEDEEE